MPVKKKPSLYTNYTKLAWLCLIICFAAGMYLAFHQLPKLFEIFSLSPSQTQITSSNPNHKTTTCEHNLRTFQPGEIYWQDDGCNYCSCGQDGLFVCETYNSCHAGDANSPELDFSGWETYRGEGFSFKYPKGFAYLENPQGKRGSDESWIYFFENKQVAGSYSTCLETADKQLQEIYRSKNNEPGAWDDYVNWEGACDEDRVAMQIGIISHSRTPSSQGTEIVKKESYADYHSSMLGTPFRVYSDLQDREWLIMDPIHEASYWTEATPAWNGQYRVEMAARYWNEESNIFAQKALTSPATTSTVYIREEYRAIMSALIRQLVSSFKVSE